MSSQEYSLVRLFSDSAPQIIDHIYLLNKEDRYLRFAYPASDENISTYVHRSISTVNSREVANFWFGIKQGEVLVATLHLSTFQDGAEFAFTTHAEHRGRKLGQLLFARGYQLVTEFSITKIYMNCLSSNAAMRHIAKKFGLAVMTQGPDCEASVSIQYPVPLKRVSEVTRTVIDKNLFL